MSSYIIPVALSVVPGSAALAVAAGRRGHNWVAALLGGGGWLLALVLRAPALAYLQTVDTLGILIAAALAGAFEEPVRSLLLRSGPVSRGSRRGAASLGIGWGLAEAFLVYAVPVAISAPAYGYGWADLLPGAVERNSAIAVHLSLTMLLARNPRSYRLVAASAALHSAVNLVAVAALLVLRDVWLVESVIAAVAAVLFAALAAPPILRRSPTRPAGPGAPTPGPSRRGPSSGTRSGGGRGPVTDQDIL